MTVPAGGGSGLSYGMTRPAHPVGYVLAEIRYLSNLFSMALFAVAFHVSLVRPVGKGDAIFKVENRRTFISKRHCCRE